MNGNEPRSEPSDERLPIGEIARRAGVSVDTVRHYERRGLIASAARTASGYRLFRAEAVRRILEVRAAVELGFGLDELTAAIAARESGAPACRSVRELLAAKGAELDRRIDELTARGACVAATLARWDRRLKATPDGRPAHLLRSLAPRVAPAGAKAARSRGSRTGSQPPGKGIEMNRPTPRLTLSLLALAAVITVPAMRAQDGMPADCPMHAEHQKKAAEAAAGAAAPAAISAPAAPTGSDSTPGHTGHAAASGSAASPYVGMESRSIAALSEEEIVALRAGSGHGMALPAEIHHYPGPRHLIDLASELALDQRAVSELTSIYDRMHADAVALGERIVAGERELDRLFADGRATSAEVSRLTGEIARLRGELRAAHLVAHVEAKALLTAEQVARYDTLRGYEAAAGAP